MRAAASVRVGGRVETLLAEIQAALPAIEGVTFLGGEPFEQRPG